MLDVLIKEMQKNQSINLLMSDKFVFILLNFAFP